MHKALTAREKRITVLVAQGLKNDEIARIIGTNENGIKNYLKTIFDKTGMWSRLELALCYQVRRGASLTWSR